MNKNPLENKSSFTLSCGEFTFILPKEEVKFYNGYGIVKPILNNENTLIGVVDKDYKIVLPLTSREYAPKLYIASNGNFIFLGYNSEIEDYQVFHIDTKGNELNLCANEFLPVNNEVMQLYYDDYSAIYDTQSGAFLTPFYNYIGPFVYSKKYDCKVARAAFYIVDEKGNVIDEVSTIINVRGEVLEDYYDLASDTKIVCRDAEEVLVLARKMYSEE